jgi:hypothetical protein
VSRLDHIELPSNFNSLSPRDKAMVLIGAFQNAVAELKNLRANQADILDQIEQLGGSITNITNIITDEFKKHAWTHSSKRDDVTDSGTDPIGPYDFDWLGEHNWTPTKDEVPVQIHGSGGGDGTHTTNVFETYDRDDAKAVEHTDEGNVLVNAATERAKVNIRAAANAPTTISDLEFWFDARTIEDDNPGISSGDQITTWRDQSVNEYIATGNKEGSATWKPLYFSGETWAGSTAVKAVFCPRGTQNNGNPGNGYCWFDLNSTFVSDANQNPEFTLIALAGNLQNWPSGFTDGNGGGNGPTGQDGMLIGDRGVSDYVGGGVASYLTHFGHPLGYTGDVPVHADWTFVGQTAGVPPADVAATTDANVGYDLHIFSWVVNAPSGTSNKDRTVQRARVNGNDETGGATRTGGNNAPFNVDKIAGAGGTYLQIALWNRQLTLDEIQSVESYFASVYGANNSNFNLPVGGFDQDTPIVEGSADILDCQDLQGNTRTIVDYDGKLGPDVDPTYRIDVEDATQAQQRWKYDDDNTMTVSVNTTGEAVFETTRVKGTGDSASQVGVKLPLMRLQAITSVIGDEPFIFVQDRGVGEGDVAWLVIKDENDIWVASALKFYGSFPSSFPT